MKGNILVLQFWMRIWVVQDIPVQEVSIESTGLVPAYGGWLFVCGQP